MLRWIGRIAGFACFCLFAGVMMAADDTPLSPTIVDATGKEITPTKWSFAFGTRKLTFLPDAPEAFELRETNSTTFKDGIITWVPLQRIEAIEYDSEMQTIRVRVVSVKEPLTGSTRFKEVNQLVLETETDAGNNGIAAVKYRGGLPRTGIRAIRFPLMKQTDPMKESGDAYTIRIAEAKGKGSSVIVRDLRPLYWLDRTERFGTALWFKKSLKIDMADIEQFAVVQPPTKAAPAECEVVKKDGTSLGLTLLATAPPESKTGQLLGLVGRVDAGYRLFPIHTISEWKRGITPDKEEEPPARIEPLKK